MKIQYCDLKNKNIYYVYNYLTPDEEAELYELEMLLRDKGDCADWIFHLPSQSPDSLVGFPFSK